jgi:hypothetical protein
VYVPGVANTAGVAFLLDTGAAARGLVYPTDVRADPELSVAGPVADTAYAPIVYAAAIAWHFATMWLLAVSYLLFVVWGALSALTGCELSDNDAAPGVLARFSAWNDRVQAALFNPNKLAPTFSESEAVWDFRYNAWYGPENAPALDAEDYRLTLAADAGG